MGAFMVPQPSIVLSSVWEHRVVTADEVGWFRSAVPVAVADAVALLAFVLVGIRSHHEIGAFDLFLRNAVPVEVMWFSVAAIIGAYRRRGLGTLVPTWIVAVPAGLVVRTLWVGSPNGFRLLTFLGVGSAFTLLFLLAGRAAAGFAGRRMRFRRGIERDSIAP
jgi:hypothetical protein